MFGKMKSADVWKDNSAKSHLQLAKRQGTRNCGPRAGFFQQEGLSKTVNFGEISDIPWGENQIRFKEHARIVNF